MEYNTVFDDAYKTLIEKYPKLIIPVINEQFGRKYPEDEGIENLSQELQKPKGDIAADSIFRISDRMYHIECQSNPDGTIAVRMLEYDFYIAMRNVEKDENGQYGIEFPKSAVIYLRHNSKTPTTMNVKVKVSESLSFDYQVPIIKMQLYSLDEILEKKLYIYLPFYLLRYEKDVEQIEADDERLKAIVGEYRKLIARLDEEYHTTDDRGRLLLYELERQMKILVEYVFEQESKAKNEIGGAIMGGTVMKTIDEEIEELKNVIKESQREIEESQKALREKEDTIREKEDAIKEKEDAIKEKEDAIKEKEDAIKEKEDTIKEKEDTIKEKEDTIKEKEAALERAMAEIERLKNLQ